MAKNYLMFNHLLERLNDNKKFKLHYCKETERKQHTVSNEKYCTILKFLCKEKISYRMLQTETKPFG
jgi:hypothetical protein